MSERKNLNSTHGQGGFSLIEALIATVILSFGLIAVTNLFVVSAASNSIANHNTSAATAAVEVMERIKAMDYLNLVPGGDLTMDTSDPNDRPQCVDNAAGPAPPPVADCVTAPPIGPGYEAVMLEQGVGEIWVRWIIVNPGAGGPDTMFITVRAESAARLAGRRSRAEFTSFRTCTSTGCP